MIQKETLFQVKAVNSKSIVKPLMNHLKRLILKSHQFQNMNRKFMAMKQLLKIGRKRKR